MTKEVRKFDNSLESHGKSEFGGKPLSGPKAITHLGLPLPLLLTSLSSSESLGKEPEAVLCPGLTKDTLTAMSK